MPRTNSPMSRPPLKKSRAGMVAADAAHTSATAKSPKANARCARGQRFARPAPSRAAHTTRRANTCTARGSSNRPERPRACASRVARKASRTRLYCALLEGTKPSVWLRSRRILRPSSDCPSDTRPSVTARTSRGCSAAKASVVATASLGTAGEYTSGRSRGPGRLARKRVHAPPPSSGGLAHTAAQST
jgi:hypothetical protein